MAKKQIKPNRTPMGEQDPKRRAHNFEEVALGYTPEEAVTEASRCLVCGKPKCIEGCPVGINIPQFLELVANQQFVEAAQAVKEANALPAICGRVCPQETQCEARCVVGRKGEAIAIGRLERFVADYERTHPEEVEAVGTPLQQAPPSGHKVAIVGSGPAGLTCARELAILGHEVTIFEALHKTGGVLVYGIPEFRLPKDIVQSEIDSLTKLGVEIQTDAVVGQSHSMEDLFEAGYQAVFLGTGAGLPRFLGLPGENLKGVMSANEFLTRINLMESYRFPEADTPVYVGRRVAVLGAGNVAMDAARCALRMGADEVWIVYRRSHDEMPARAEEIHHAEQEGIQFQYLTAPKAILGTDDEWVSGLECIKMELGEPDESGRRRPQEVPGSEFTFDCDMVINALGSDINQLIFREAKDVKRSKWGTVVVDEATGATNVPGIYAGGDLAIGAATVILAMGTGKKAAAGIDEYLKSLEEK